MIDYVAQIIDSGIKPFESVFQEIKFMSNKRVFAYRMSININSMDLGVLTPSEYVPVADADLVCIRLALRNLRAAMLEIIKRTNEGEQFDFIVAKVPVLLLKKSNIVKVLEKLIKDTKLDEPRKLCIEFSSDLFYEETENVGSALKKIARTGVRTMLSGFGNEFSPLLRIDGLHFDFILLDPYVTQIAKDNRGTNTATIMMLAKKNADNVFASAVTSAEESLVMNRIGCGAFLSENIYSLTSR